MAVQLPLPKKSHLVRWSRTVFGTALMVVLLVFLLGSLERGFGQGEKKKKAPPRAKAAAGPGLRGLLPAEVPDALIFEEFEPLGKAWEAWTEAVQQDLAALYEGEESNAQTQRKTIASLRNHLKKAEAAIADEKTPAAIRQRLISLRGGIVRRIDVAEAALDTLEADPKTARKEHEQQAWADVTTALNKLEQYLNEFDGGKAWLGYLHVADIRKAAKEGNANASALSQAVQRIRNRGKLKSADQREFLGGQAFLRVERTIARLQKLHQSPLPKINMPRLRATLKKLLHALEEYEATASEVSAANARAAYDDLFTLSADGGNAIANAMKNHYFNYNFRIYIAEPFLNRLLGETRTEQGTIRDYALGASIYGNQVTTTKVGVDLKPSKNIARFDITLNGTVRANTVGVTDQANVYTSGYHQFWAAKEVKFDGERFYADSPARISVSANNYTYDASTSYSHVPLLGGIADRIAVKEANKRRPESEALARQKIRNQVSEEFNAEVEKKFAEANKEFKEKVLKTLEENGLKPNAQSVRTTDELLLISSRVMNDSELAGSSTNPGEAPGWGVTLRIHQSAINNALNRLNIAGRTLTEDELTEELEKALKNVLGDRKKKGKAGKSEKKSNDRFVFDSHDPIRVLIRNGQIQLVLRTGLKRPGQEDIPTQIITVPLKISVVGNAIVIDRGTVGVAPAKKPDNAAAQIARAGIMRNKIEAALPDKKEDPVLTLSEEKGKKPVKVTIVRINTVNGWVTVWAK